MFGYPKSQRAAYATARYELTYVGRPATLYATGVGVTLLWHGWEYGRGGARRPLPLTGHSWGGATYTAP